MAEVAKYENVGDQVLHFFAANRVLNEAKRITDEAIEGRYQQHTSWVNDRSTDPEFISPERALELFPDATSLDSAIAGAWVMNEIRKRPWNESLESRTAEIVGRLGKNEFALLPSSLERDLLMILDEDASHIEGMIDLRVKILTQGASGFSRHDMENALGLPPEYHSYRLDQDQALHELRIQQYAENPDLKSAYERWQNDPAEATSDEKLQLMQMWRDTHAQIYEYGPYYYQNRVVVADDANYDSLRGSEPRGSDSLAHVRIAHGDIYSRDRIFTMHPHEAQEMMDHEASHLMVAHNIVIFDTMDENDPRRQFTLMAASDLAATVSAKGSNEAEALMNVVQATEYDAYVHDSPHAIGYRTARRALENAADSVNANAALRADVLEGNAKLGRSYISRDENNPVSADQPGYEVYWNIYAHNLSDPDDIEEMQRGLRDMGLYGGPIDQNVNEQTATAMMVYFQTHPTAQSLIREEHLLLFMRNGQGEQAKELFEGDNSIVNMRFRETILNQSALGRIEEKQTWLKAAGYYDGPIDDETNPEYEQAFKQAQQELLVETHPTLAENEGGELELGLTRSRDAGLTR